MRKYKKANLSRLGKVIESKGIKPAWLAERIGVSYQTMRNYRCGINTPDANLLYKISQILGVKMEDLIDTEDSKIK